jgi:DnaJ-class molecular chaperone
MIQKIKCSKCNGDGWYYDHSDRHYGTGNSETCDEAGCPIQRQCETCYGQGYFEFEE